MYYYLDLAVQFITKMTMQVVPFIAGLIILLATITFFKKDTRWLINLFKRIVNI